MCLMLCCAAAAFSSPCDGVCSGLAACNALPSKLMLKLSTFHRHARPHQQQTCALLCAIELLSVLLARFWPLCTARTAQKKRAEQLARCRCAQLTDSLEREEGAWSWCEEEGQ